MFWKRQRLPQALQTVSSTIKHSVSIVKYSVESGWDTRPSAIDMFWKCFGSDLSTRPNSIGSSYQSQTQWLLAEKVTPQPQFLIKNKGKEHSQSATVSSTMQILYGTVSSIKQCVCVHSKSPVFFSNVLIHSKITMICKFIVNYLLIYRDRVYIYKK